MRYGDMSKDKYVMVRYNIAKELIDAHPQERILDIGCYDGYFLSMLDADVYGFDTDLEALQEAEKKGVKILPNLNPPFKFDKIVCMEMLEHLRNPQAMLEKIKSLLVDNGTVIVSLPNECNLWSRIRMLFGLGINDLPFDPAYHLHFPTLSQSEDLISRNFTIKNKRYWVYGLPQFFKFFPTLFARGVIYECY